MLLLLHGRRKERAISSASTFRSSSFDSTQSWRELELSRRGDTRFNPRNQKWCSRKRSLLCLLKKKISFPEKDRYATLITRHIIRGILCRAIAVVAKGLRKWSTITHLVAFLREEKSRRDVCQIPSFSLDVLDESTVEYLSSSFVSHRCKRPLEGGKEGGFRFQNDWGEIGVSRYRLATLDVISSRAVDTYLPVNLETVCHSRKKRFFKLSPILAPSS